MSTETTQAPAKAEQAKPSAVEGVKLASRQLRGTIALELAKDSDHFSDADKNLIKFHGTYQQEDRDARKHRTKEGVGKHYMFMVRCKIPGGRLTPAQYLAVDDLAGQYANGTIRFTTRQGIQLHGILKTHLKDTIAGINACLLSTLGACGDVERNVMACPAPHHDGVHAQLQETAAVLAAHLAPRTSAYHEIWLNGERVKDEAASADIEPLYGKVYLPRKFKTGLALPEDNCIDIYAQDLGLLAIVENGAIVGYNVLVGGGMGMTHGNANTFPHVARPICYVPASAVVIAAEAVVRLFRDHGNRGDRKRARIKYLVHDWGVEKFRQVLADYLGGIPHPPRPVDVRDVDAHLGWHEQGDGKWFFGLSVENGRIKDEGAFRLRTVLRTLIERYRPGLRITPMQDILLCDLDASAKPEIEKLLAEHGVLRPDQLPTVQKWSMACPAVPTCGLALSESERALPGIIDQLDVEFRRLGLENERITVRMTGCPNGCARPYQSDIGLVGRSGDKYSVFVGGNLLGNRLNFMLRDLVPLASIVPTLSPLLEHFVRERQPGEGFGNFCHRLGADKLQALLPAAATRHAGKQTDNGDAAQAGNGDASPAHDALPAPAVRDIPVALAPIGVTGARLTLPAAFKQSETFLAGLPGEERADFTYRYNSDGSIRETVVYYYGPDLRAGQASGDQPLHREAVYLAKADPIRLHAVRKLSDTFHVGAPGHERRDRRVDYLDDSKRKTVVYFYEGDLRAADAPSGAPLRRQVVYDGVVS